jgi:hypothetical protein
VHLRQHHTYIIISDSPFWFRKAVASSSVISSSLDIPSTCLAVLPVFISLALRRLVRRPSRSAARLECASSSSRLRFGPDGGQDPVDRCYSYYPLPCCVFQM